MTHMHTPIGEPPPHPNPVRSVNQPTEPGVIERRNGYRGFFVFTVLLWTVLIGTGVVIGLTTGTGLGLGDTHLVTITNHSKTPDSLFGEFWRLAVSFAALGAMPVIWYLFLNKLGDFGYGGRDGDVASVDEQLQSLMDSERRHPMATIAAYRQSWFSAYCLMCFGNFFLPFVVIRFGWGPA